MKHVILIGLCLTLGCSPKKDYRCECEYQVPGVKGTGHTTHLIHDTQSNAQNICSGYDQDIKSIGSCTLY